MHGDPMMQCCQVIVTWRRGLSHCSVFLVISVDLYVNVIYLWWGDVLCCSSSWVAMVAQLVQRLSTLAECLVGLNPT